MASPLSSGGGDRWRRNGGVRWLVGEISHGRPRIHPHKSPSAPAPSSIASGEPWQLFGVGKGSREPATGSSGEAEDEDAGRQPAALAAKAIAGYLTHKQPAGAKNELD